MRGNSKAERFTQLSKLIRELEERIASVIIEDALAAGYLLSVSDGEDYVLVRSKDKVAVLAAMFSTDEDHLVVYRPGQRRAGSVRFVYGNSGWDVVCDYTCNLEHIMARANALADEYSP